MPWERDNPGQGTCSGYVTQSLSFTSSEMHSNVIVTVTVCRVTGESQEPVGKVTGAKMHRSHHISKKIGDLGKELLSNFQRSYSVYAYMCVCV